MTLIVSLVLSVIFFGTKDIATRNEAVFNKRAILKAAADFLPKSLDEMSDDEVLGIYANDMEQLILNMNGETVEVDGMKAEDIDMAQEKKKDETDRLLPLFVYEASGEKIYLFSVRGVGLWDEIWGTIAVKDDLNTIVGASFDHVQETPGLGAEIKDNPAFARQFKEKTLVNDGVFTGVNVVKGAIKNPSYEVNGISGATVTGVGVAEMLQRGLKYYTPYLDKIKG